MAVDFQINQSSLIQILTDWIPACLRQPMPSAPGRFVDHLDVVVGDTFFTAKSRRASLGRNLGAGLFGH